MSDERYRDFSTEDAKGRTGIFTTGIISRISDDRLISLYYTGRKHAGENICDRSLKQCILHRKNSLFYKTAHGAFIGDMFMSLINTCSLMKVNPLDYLTSLIKNTFVLFKNPALWMLWNYKRTVT